MQRSVVPPGPHPCTGRSELFLQPAGEIRDAQREREAAAKVVCAECDVTDECLEQGLLNRVAHGARNDLDIYGGFTPRERVELLRLLPLVAS